MILAPGKNKDLLATLVEFGYAEYGSALEMLAAAKSTESPKAKIGYINHALDEYRHAALIFKVLNTQINQGIGEFQKAYIFAPQHVVSKGYVDKGGFLVEKLDNKKFIEFVYSNEYLAKEAFEGLSKRIEDIESLNVISNIMAEEEEHAGSSLETLEEIMVDEGKHWGYAKKAHEKLYPDANLNKAFRREKLKNKFRLFYFKNFKFLSKIFDPILNTIIFLFGGIVKLLIIPVADSDNLMAQNEHSVI